MAEPVIYNILALKDLKITRAGASSSLEVLASLPASQPKLPQHHGQQRRSRHGLVAAGKSCTAWASNDRVETIGSHLESLKKRAGR